MKALHLTAITMALASSTLAQTTVSTNTALDEWARNALSIKNAKNLSEASILHPTDAPFASTFMDTLLKYDWVDAGSFCYQDDHFVTNPQLNNRQVDVFRFLPDGTCKDFTVTFNNASGLPELKEGGNSEGEKITLRSKAGQTFLCFRGGLDACMHVVSYRDGVLLYDVDDGEAEPGDDEYPVRYRNVLVAVPRGF